MTARPSVRGKDALDEAACVRERVRGALHVPTRSARACGRISRMISVNYVSPLESEMRPT